MLPFLKKKDDGVGVGPVEAVERKPDEPSGMLEAVATDMLDAVKKGDRALLKGALEALCMHIMDMDSEQDQMMGD